MARRTKAEAEATRARILDAAEQLFERAGVARTTLQEIAQAAGVTRGAVYWHFKDKVDLFNAMMERVTLPLESDDLADPAAGGRRRDAAALGQLRDLLMAKLTHVATDPRVQRVIAIATHKVEYVEDFDAARQRHLRVIDDFRARVGALLRQAGMDDAMARRQAVGLQALLAGLMQTWMLAPERLDLVDTGRLAVDTFIDGVAARLAADAG
jgi:TetR/AcrR family acrAB operon transcriptional repressor